MAVVVCIQDRRDYPMDSGPSQARLRIIGLIGSEGWGRALNEVVLAADCIS
jgi:hypothetical protein